jgi:hypothetical protein
MFSLSLDRRRGSSADERPPSPHEGEFERIGLRTGFSRCCRRKGWRPSAQRLETRSGQQAKRCPAGRFGHSRCPPRIFGSRAEEGDELCSFGSAGLRLAAELRRFERGARKGSSAIKRRQPFARKREDQDTKGTAPPRQCILSRAPLGSGANFFPPFACNPLISADSVK